MKTLLTFMLILTGCSTVSASEPDYVERTDQSAFNASTVNEPATVPNTPHAVRGEHLQLIPPPEPEYNIDPEWLCVEWFPLSIEAGFEPSDWPRVGIIAYRESRCRPEVHNATDPSGGSFGIMQVNCSWRRYLADRGILQRCHELHDPYTNFRCGTSNRPVRP